MNEHVSLRMHDVLGKFTLFTKFSTNSGGYILFKREIPLLFGWKVMKRWASKFSSFMGEAHAIKCALKQVYWMIRGSTIRTFTDSVGSMQKLSDENN